MGRIKASLADVSTEFQPLEPGLFEFEITKFEDVEKNGEFVAYRVSNKVTTAGDNQGKVVTEYIHLKKPGEEIAPDAIGLQTVKRYFEVAFGKDEVATWTDDDYDTDKLIGKMFQAQVVIDSYTKEGETEPRRTNKFKRMEPLD
jgi:hypothetical protein